MDTETVTTTAPLTIRERQIHIFVMENPGYPPLTRYSAEYARLAAEGYIGHRHGSEGYWPNYG